MPEHFPAPYPDELADEATPPAGGTELATFGSGCFWCTEAVFQQMKGVTKVVSGFSGGHVKKPDLRAGVHRLDRPRRGGAGDVRPGGGLVPGVIGSVLAVARPDHARPPGPRRRPPIPLRNLLSLGQRRLAGRYKQKIDAAGVFPKLVVTEVVPSTDFYPAEAYH